MELNTNYFPQGNHGNPIHLPARTNKPPDAASFFDAANLISISSTQKVTLLIL
jgi:hypothetical protein